MPLSWKGKLAEGDPAQHLGGIAAGKSSLESGD